MKKKYDKSIILLTTDTPHHNYFFNELIKKNIEFKQIYYQTKFIKVFFKTNSKIENYQNNFESKKFLYDKSIINKNTKKIISFNSESTIKKIKLLQPKLGVVFGTEILSEDVINLFRDGLINVHRGIISQYRGLDSDLWAYYHKDYYNIGTTIHFINKSIDKGNIILQKRLKEAHKVNVEKIRYYTTKIAVDLCSIILKEYLQGKKVTSKIQKKFGRYYSYMPRDIKNTLV